MTTGVTIAKIGAPTGRRTERIDAPNGRPARPLPLLPSQLSRLPTTQHIVSKCRDETDTPDVGSEILSVSEVLLTVEDAAVLAGFKAAVTHDANSSAALI